MSSPADPAPAVGRAIALLRYLGGEGGCSLDTLARAHAWPKPSVLRLLRSLALAGLVARDPQTRLWQTLMRLVPSQGPEYLLRAQLAGALPGLADELGHTVELYHYAGATMDLIDRAEPASAGVTVRARIGFQRTFDEAEAVTLIAAAFAQAPSQRRRWRWTRTPGGPERLALDARTFAGLAESVRSRGMARDAEANEWGISRCAVPIRDEQGVLQGALAAALTGDGADGDAIARGLLAAIERMARERMARTSTAPLEESLT